MDQKKRLRPDIDEGKTRKIRIVPAITSGLGNVRSKKFFKNQNFF